MAPTTKGRVVWLLPWELLLGERSVLSRVGFIIAALVDRHHAPQWLRVGLVVGFCGGYTTFSTFAQETLDLVETRDLATRVCERRCERPGRLDRSQGRASRLTAAFRQTLLVEAERHVPST